MNENQPFEVPQSTQQKIIYSTGCAFALTKWIIVLVIFVTLIHFFIGTLAIVDGVSMEPNFHTGEYILVNRLDYNLGKFARGDAVVLKFPGDPERKKYIKRIIGLPGERVEVKNDRVYINGKLLNEPYIPSTVSTESPSRIVNEIVKPDEYFIMGDNRPNSNDSRVWGTAGRRFLIGKAVFQILPKFKKIDSINY